MVEFQLSDDQLQQYADEGYFIVKQLLDTTTVDEICREITAIVDRYPETPTELIQFEPSVIRGDDRPDTTELGVRKLFRMVMHNAFFRELASNPNMVSIARRLVGDNVVLAQSMSLMKPPRIGGAKVWHQDNAYFRLSPCDVFGFWVACDSSTTQNGCMRVVPGSHKRGLVPHSGEGDHFGLVEPPDEDGVADVPLEPGDALVFHGELVHSTRENRTDSRRRAIQYHYASADCRRQSDESPYGLHIEKLIAGVANDAAMASWAGTADG